MIMIPSKKSLRNIAIALFLIIAVLPAIIFFNRPKKDNYGKYIMKDDYVVIESTYESDTDKINYDFPININEHGKKYKLLDAESSVISKGYTLPYVHTAIETGKTIDEINPQEELKVNFNGSEISVYLVDKQMENLQEQREPGKATSFTDFDLCVSYPNIPRTKDINYHDEETKTTKKVTLTLDDVVTKQAARWVDDVKIPLTFNVYGADYYELYNEQIPHNDDAPMLQGKEHLILQMLGLDASCYRIESFAWKGGEYEKDGEKKRDAIAYGSRYVTDYRANYSNNNIILPRANTVKATLTYKSKENLTGDIIYTVNVKGIYAPVNNSMNYILGAFLLLLFVVIALYVIASQKEKEEERK